MCTLPRRTRPFDKIVWNNFGHAQHGREATKHMDVLSNPRVHHLYLQKYHLPYNPITPVNLSLMCTLPRRTRPFDKIVWSNFGHAQHGREATKHMDVLSNPRVHHLYLQKYHLPYNPITPVNLSLMCTLPRRMRPFDKIVWNNFGHAQHGREATKHMDVLSNPRVHHLYILRYHLPHKLITPVNLSLMCTLPRRTRPFDKIVWNNFGHAQHGREATKHMDVLSNPRVHHRYILRYHLPYQPITPVNISPLWPPAEENSYARQNSVLLYINESPPQCKISFV